jgi:5'-3' exonuclease
VRGDRIVQFDRRNRTIRNEAGVKEKFGLGPRSIPDYLALVGDSSDGFPGVPGWGEKSASALLARYEHLEAIPQDVSKWEVSVRGAAKLSQSLRDHWEEALLFRTLATSRTDVDVFTNVDELLWRGPTAEFAALCQQLGVPELAETWLGG